jgi:HEPN domain-containing protein
VPSGARYNHIFEDMISVWPILDGFYIPNRYPSSVHDSIPARVYTKYAASEAVALAEEIVGSPGEK